MADLDHKHPIIFFPIRIETKYHKSEDGVLKLRIRLYPDQITVNNFDPRLTRKEVEDARDYWKTAGFGTDQRNSAWIKLANHYGLPRAAYISKAVINYDPDIEADPLTPSLKADNEIPVREENDDDDDVLAATCEMLPTRFKIYGKFKDNKLGTIRKIGNRIPQSLQLNPLPLQNISLKESNWVTDFLAAVEIGMAIEIVLTQEQYESGFDYIIAFGVQDNLSPEESKNKIENLFTAHRYTFGLKLVKQGTPTNLVRETLKDGQSFFPSHHHPTQSDSITYRSVEFGALDEEHQRLIRLHTPDGRVLNRALGIDKAANGLPYANNYDQLTAACMSSSLWPSVLGYFMDKFANIQSLDLESLQNHFVKYVSAQGVVPPICIGKTPYGILPVTILSEWKDEALLPGTEHIRTFFDHLKRRWTMFIDKVPTIMKNNSDVSDNLLEILSMEAFSRSYNVRGFRSLNYIADFIFEILDKKNAKGEKIVNSQDLVVKNKLLLNILLKLTFPLIPDEVLRGFYENCPGSGISRIEFPMVSQSEKEDDLPPDYIEKIYNDIKGTDRSFLKTTKDQIEIPGIGPSNSDPLLLRLLRYSASLIGEKNDPEEIEKFIESLEILRKINPERLKTLMLQTMDLVSYRLDAWITSFANQRLDHLRSTTGKGVYIGAFGWIENLKPRELQNIPEGGYIQAPSYTHAAAAAVLRNGYMTHSNDPEKKDLLKINLNSERTKNALEIINGIVHTPLPELIGYKLERRLHDANLDYLIDEFRKYFPLNKEDNKKLEDILEPGQERIEPRNLTDGLVVFKNWKRLIDGIAHLTPDATNIIKFMEDDDQVPGWKSFYAEIKNKYAVQDENIINLINDLKKELNFLLYQMDGVSDLCLAESVFQAVSGNYSRSGAVLDGMSGDGNIPAPEISFIPRTGARQIQRVALAFEVEPLENLKLDGVDDTIQWINPRRLAEPNIDKLLKCYIGTVLFWIDLKDLSGNVTSTEEVDLAELGLESIDLIYIENSELDARINYYAKRKGFKTYDIRYERNDSTPEEIEKRSLVDLQFLINALREMMNQGRPLNYSDFQRPNQTNQKKLVLNDIKEIFQRYYNIILLLVQTIKELESALNDITDNGIEKKRQALFKAGFFESEFAVPLTNDGKIIELVEDLNKKIEVAILEFKSRLPQADSQTEKLLEWKSKLETEGEESFLESLVDELSGEAENNSRYIKTIELLVGHMRKILDINSFLILSPFTVPSDTELKSSSQIDARILKWMEKTSYVRPRIKLLDEIITYNQILESSNFSFYCDEMKFTKDAEMLVNEEEEEELVNPVSLILAMSIRTDEDNIHEPLTKLAGVAGIVADDWTDKIVSKEQDTHIAFHYNTPNSEPPQCLLLAVSPNDLHRWDEPSIFKLILETLELTKLRAVDYRSVKELRHFLPTIILNSHGEDIFINLFQGSISG